MSNSKYVIIFSYDEYDSIRDCPCDGQSYSVPENMIDARCRYNITPANSTNQG